jgi:uncharacterized repeat protein (TIGR02543 family)
MKRTLLIPSLLLLSTVLTTSPAAAAPAWTLGTPQSINFNCSSTGNVPGTQTWVGYVNDTANPLKTGATGYVTAVAKNIGACNDSVTMEILLPAGAVRDTTKDVYCIREKVGGGSDPIQNCAPWGFNGPNGGLMFTSSPVLLAPQWYLEIQIPVVYNAELLGSAGGVNHLLGVKTMNGLTYAIPSVPVTVAYQPKFESFTTSGITASSASVSLTAFNYLKAGQLSIDYGTSGSFGMSTNPVALSSMYVSYSNSGATLPNLSASTTYYWRARYVTSSGTFTSTTQSFTTGQAPVLTIAKAGRGLGKVTSNPVYFDCGDSSANLCSATTAPGLTISLIATPSNFGYAFTGWSGACTGTGACTVTMDASKSVTANFDYFDTRTATPLPDPRPRRL